MRSSTDVLRTGPNLTFNTIAVNLYSNGRTLNFLEPYEPNRIFHDNSYCCSAIGFPVSLLINRENIRRERSELVYTVNRGRMFEPQMFIMFMMFLLCMFNGNVNCYKICL